ncbi:hypothetical protein D3C83_05530 [compost metagenome]
MRTLPKANDVNRRDALRSDQAAAHHLVSGDVSPNPGQEQCLSLGVDASSRRVLSHRLADKAQVDPGDGGAGGGSAVERAGRDR